MTRSRLFTLAAALLAVLAMATPAQAGHNILTSGDISNPPGDPRRGDRQTAALLNPATNGTGLVLNLGDNQYECGQLANYQTAYAATWGRYKAITRPTPGNHEFETCNASGRATGVTLPPALAANVGYYTYFAGLTPPHPGYYSHDYAGWHIIHLNTTCDSIADGCSGAMLSWLKQDLAAHRATKCTMVVGHHPFRVTAAPYASTHDLLWIWPTLVLNDVDLYLSGHNHAYESGRPIRTQGNIDEDYGPGDGDDGHSGVRWVVAGLGGRSIIPFRGRVNPASLYRYDGGFGVFKLVPNSPGPGQWVQAFKTAAGGTLDRHGYRCH